MHLTIDKNGIKNEDQKIYVQKKNENDSIKEKNEKNIKEEKMMIMIMNIKKMNMKLKKITKSIEIYQQIMLKFEEKK